MKNKDLQKQWDLSYEEQLKYLKLKYGRVKKDYFTDVDCRCKSTDNTRTLEGLFIHHDYEYDKDDKRVCDLSDPLHARLWPWYYQIAENLTYCNWLEHLMLHIKINLLRKEQLGFYIKDAVENYFIKELNRLYTFNYDIDKIEAWKLQCFNFIDDEYEDYYFLIDSWIDKLGCQKINWKKI